MIAISPALAATFSKEDSGIFGAMLIRIASSPVGGDRSLDYRTPRPGWTSREVSDNPVLQRVFAYDRDFTGTEQVIMIYENPEQGFRLVTAKLIGEPDVECLIVGEGFMLITRSLPSAGWSTWDNERLTDVGEEEIRMAVDA